MMAVGGGVQVGEMDWEWWDACAQLRESAKADGRGSRPKLEENELLRVKTPSIESIIQ